MVKITNIPYKWAHQLLKSNRNLLLLIFLISNYYMTLAINLIYEVAWPRGYKTIYCAQHIVELKRLSLISVEILVQKEVIKVAEYIFR